MASTKAWECHFDDEFGDAFRNELIFEVTSEFISKIALPCFYSCNVFPKDNTLNECL